MITVVNFDQVLLLLDVKGKTSFKKVKLTIIGTNLCSIRRILTSIRSRPDDQTRISVPTHSPCIESPFFRAWSGVQHNQKNITILSFD